MTGNGYIHIWSQHYGYVQTYDDIAITGGIQINSAQTCMTRFW